MSSPTRGNDPSSLAESLDVERRPSTCARHVAGHGTARGRCEGIDVSPDRWGPVDRPPLAHRARWAGRRRRQAGSRRGGCRHPVADAECRPNGRLGRVDWSERRPSRRDAGDRGHRVSEQPGQAVRESDEGRDARPKRTDIRCKEHGVSLVSRRTSFDCLPGISRATERPPSFTFGVLWGLCFKLKPRGP